jgi:signal transduction histidine kinase
MNVSPKLSRTFSLNITQKFIAYLMFLSIIPLVMVGVVAYRNSADVLQAESRRTTRQLIANQQDYIDLQLSQLASLITNVSNVEEIRNSLAEAADRESSGESSGGNAFNNLSTQARIGYILNGYSNLTGLVSIDIFTENGTSYHVGDTLDVQNIRQNVRNRIFTETVNSGQSILWVGIEDNVNANSSFPKVITAAKMIYRIDDETFQQRPLALFIVNYSIEELYEHLNPIDFGEGGYVLVMDGKNRLVYHPNPALRGQVITEQLAAALSGSEGTLDNVTIEGVPMSVSYTTSDYSGWKIASFVPVATFNAKASGIGAVLSAVLLISFGIVAFGGFLYNRTVVRPIQQITESFKQLPNIPAEKQQRLVPRSNDEVGELVRWFNAFLDNQIVKQRAEQTLLNRMQFEQIIAENSTQFIAASAEQIGGTIRNTLKAIGTGLGIDQAYAVLLRTTTDDTYHWSKMGHLPTNKALNEIPLWTARLAHLKPVVIADVAELGADWQAEKTVLTARGVKSMALIPMISEEKLAGFVAFETVDALHGWDEETIALLNLIGQSVISSLDRIEAEKERDALILQLKDSLVFKDQFLATMSHELRTPLNAIQGYSGLIREEEGVSEDVRYMAERVLHNAARLLELINDVLDISRINANRVEIVPRPVALKEVITNWYEDFKTQTADKGLQFELVIDPALPTVAHVDEARLTQIAANLLQNALKFTQQGKISLHAKYEGKTWSFSVSDSGIGIPESWLHMIFDEFRQVDNSSKRKYGGAGLGLSIVKKLCILMGGNVLVTSKLGEGSTFTVTMPLIVDEPVTKEQFA